jgi:hypothetical protein
MSYAEQIERKIVGKMSAIKRRELKASESGIGLLFNKLKEIDEGAYEKRLGEYKNILAGLQNNKK